MQIRLQDARAVVYSTQDLALKLAQESIVLLQNDKGIINWWATELLVLITKLFAVQVFFHLILRTVLLSLDLILMRLLQCKETIM